MKMENFTGNLLLERRPILTSKEIDYLMTEVRFMKFFGTIPVYSAASYWNRSMKNLELR